MKYKVLYRKYRPDNFDNIIGQDYIVTTLKNSIISGNISHAYIFSGPRGTGKTSTAKVFAKAINCINNVDGSPCGKCEFCVNYQENPDIIEIDAASNNGVDEIRQLIENVKLTPTNGKYKVYIIDEVHMLTISAFNALLLTLEEPPAHTIFIFATTNIESVPITILSRCQRFDFQKVKTVDIVNRLKSIADIEKIAIDDDALNEIAYLSEGGMRDALSLLDQLSKNKEKITVNLIEKQIKTLSRKTIEEFIMTIEENNMTDCLKLISDMRDRAIDYKLFAKKFIDIASSKAKNIALTGKTKRLSLNDYKELIFSLIDSLNKVNINVDSFIMLEMIVLKYFKNTNENPKIPEKVVQNLNLSPEPETENNKPEEKLSITDDVLEKIISTRVNNCFVDAQKNILEKTKKELESLLLTNNMNGKIKSILTDSLLVAASSQYLIFSSPNIHNASLANKMLEDIENVLNSELNTHYKVIFLTEDRWKDEKNKYIQNIKNNVKYTYIEEPSPNKVDDVIINDVFNKDKIEII